MVTGQATAKVRKGPSIPAKWLVENRYVTGWALDYGCGRGADCEAFGWIGWDPKYRPRRPVIRYSRVVCTYVFNVLEQGSRQEVLDDLMRFVAPDGAAYITVRRDLPPEGATGRGCYQHFVRLEELVGYNIQSIRKNSSYEIYEVTK